MIKFREGIYKRDAIGRRNARKLMSQDHAREESC